MIKKFFTLLCLCTLCIGSAWGNIIYEKVTSSLSDWSGEYLIVYESNNVAFDGSLTNLDATPNTFSVTISNNVITLSDADATAKQFTITAAETSGEYYIKSASEYYIWGTSTNGISSNTSISNAKTNTISYSNSTFTIKGKGGSKTLSFNSDKNQLKFRYLGTTLIQLYKKQSGTPSKTLESIVISGTPDKTEYKSNEAFDPTGLTVTGYYDDETNAPITSGIEWAVTPSGALTVGTTSVTVTAKVGEVTSDQFEVTGLTVTQFVQTYANTYTSNVELTTTGGTSASAAKVVIDGTNYDAIKAGTGKAAGSCIVTIPENTKTLHFHAAGWKGETVTLTVTTENDETGTNYNLVADEGVNNN